MKNFFAYFKALNMGLDTSVSTSGGVSIGSVVELYIAGGSMVLCALLFGNLGGLSLPVSALLLIFFGGSVTVSFFGTRIRPYVYALLPISPARKAAYFFLCCLVNFLIIIGIVLAVTVLTSLLVAVIIFATTHEWTFVFEESANIIPNTCPQGEGVAVAASLFFVGVTFAANTFKNKLLRYGSIYASALVLFAPLRIFASLGGIASGELFIRFDSVPLSWVMLLVYAIVAAAALVFGVVRTVLYLRPKKY